MYVGGKNMKNKLVSFILVIYVILILGLSIATAFRLNLVHGFTIIMQSIFIYVDVNHLHRWIHFLCLILVYIGLSLLLLLFILNYTEQKRILIFYTLLSSLAIAATSEGIISFQVRISWIDYIVIVSSILFGIFTGFFGMSILVHHKTKLKK